MCTVLLQSLRLLCASWQQPFGASGNRSSVGTKPLANGTLHTPLVTLLSLLVYDLVLWTIRLLRRHYGFDVSSKESLIISQSLTCWWLQFFCALLSKLPPLSGKFFFCRKPTSSEKSVVLRFFFLLFLSLLQSNVSSVISALFV